MRRWKLATSAVPFRCPADRKVRRAVCFFAGDDACQFYVNGVPIGVSHGHPNLVAAEITPHLRPGTNLLAAAATNSPANVVQNPGGWIGVVRIDFEDGPPLIIHSDQTWRCAKDARRRLATGDLRRSDMGPGDGTGRGRRGSLGLSLERTLPRGRLSSPAGTLPAPRVSGPCRQGRAAGQRPTSAASAFSISTSTAS